MENSDTVFLLTTLDIPSLKNLKIALETLRLVNFPVDRLRVVMNRADSKVGLDAQGGREDPRRPGDRLHPQLHGWCPQPPTAGSRSSPTNRSMPSPSPSIG